MLKSVTNLRLEGISPSDYYKERMSKTVSLYIRALLTEAEFLEDMAELTEAVVSYKHSLEKAWGNE